MFTDPLFSELAVNYEELETSILKEKIDPVKLQAITSKCRALVQAISKASGVDIEPESSTVVIDEILKVEGICCAGAPGAGGYDAIYALGLKPCRDRVQALLDAKFPSCCVLPVSLL